VMLRLPLMSSFTRWIDVRRCSASRV
jgi:hypothetical protein